MTTTINYEIIIPFKSNVGSPLEQGKKIDPQRVRMGLAGSTGASKLVTADSKLRTHELPRIT
jgi:hypothetical protein